MDAWSTSIFDDDDAMDWLDELCTSDGTDLLSDAFAQTGNDYLAAPDGSRILCAAAALAVALGHDVPNAPELLNIWAAGLFEDDIRALLPDATAAVARVLGDGSGLQERWQGNAEAYPKWKAQVKGLAESLR